MKWSNPYSILGWLAMITVPVAPAMFFGWKAYYALLVLTGTNWLAVPGGIIAAFGLEAVGIFAGHVSIDAYRRRDNRWMLASIIMLVYVAIGTWELWDNSIGRVTFLIAALVYILRALQFDIEAVDELTSKQADVAVMDAAAQAKVDAAKAEADAERAHQFRLRQLDAQAQVKMNADAAQAQAKVAAAKVNAEVKIEKLRQPRVVEGATVSSQPKSTVNHPSTVDELTPGQRRVYDAMKENPKLTQADLAVQMGVSRQAISKHVKAINGLATRPQLIG